MKAYLELLKFPAARSLILAAFPARFAYGMISLGLYWKIYHVTHSFAVAGLALGINTVAGSLTTGMRANLLDRWGLKWPLRIIVPSYALSILIINSMTSRTGLILAAALLGICAPPINLSVRPMWKSAVPPEQMRTALALDTATMNLAQIVGPVAVTPIALSSHSGWALGLCALLIFTGGVSLSLLRITGEWKPEISEHKSSRIFKIPGIRLLVIEGIFIGLGAGIVQVAIPALATIQRVPGMTAWIFAAQSFTMIIGSLIAGAFAKHLSPLRAFTKNYYFWAIAGIPLAFTNPNWSMVVVYAAVGLFVGAQQVFYLEIIEAVRPYGTSASALGWMWTIEGSAAAIGLAIGGFLSQHFNPHICLAINSATVFGGLFTVLLGQKYLKKADKTPAH